MKIFIILGFISFILFNIVNGNENDIDLIRVNAFIGDKSDRVLAMKTKKPTKKTISPTLSPTPMYSSKRVGTFNWPVGFSFLPDGRFIIVERFSGMVCAYDAVNNVTTMVTTITGIDPDPSSHDGLINVAVHPNFSKKPYLYVYATRHVKGKGVDQVIKVTWNAEMKGMAKKQSVIFSFNRLPGARDDGGRLLFGPDGYLYFMVGDQDKGALAQDMKSPAGKWLRMKDDGSRPSDNPFPKSLIWAYGYRNTIGGTFDPKTGYFWANDNGPICNDEINLIEKGANYGWGPTGQCPNPTNVDGPDIHLPKALYNGLPVAPVGMAFATESNSLFVGFFAPGSIRKIDLTTNGTDIAVDHGIVFYAGASEGNILGVEADSNKNLFYSTINGIFMLEKN